MLSVSKLLNNMSLLKPHEKIVLDRLTGKVLASELLSELKEKGIVTSYKITGSNKSDTLHISDPASFWSESKYLVIMVK